ncbi:trithorax group protein osa-like [Aricia agestis]|uniref:trithorax group protein osa-like n=1 Tax=Aricia agestis TaxID=91739 RepID=UPI001C208285|nr:trithorax group protein osa-like [Aricia agestis]
MKLVIVLSVIAFGYAAKLDRTYLPPSSAATAGGSPGAITAPDSGFGRSPAAEFGQNLPNGPSSGPSGAISNVPTGQGSNQGSFPAPRPSYGPPENQVPSQAGLPATRPSFGQPGSQGSNQGAFPGPRPSFGQPGNQASNQGAFPGTSSFKDNEIGSDDALPSGQINAQGSRTPFGQAQDFAQEPRPERPQAAADRNAEILKYVNENNGDSYEYSYETSNGISAGESGVATNGVMAQGGFSYTGDDGKPYSITYTADENGFQPQGEHLPTPHPIPEEILKSIEENARAAASGTQEGAYRPEEYESESSPQQYGNGAQQGSTFPGESTQRRPDQGSFMGDRQAAGNNLGTSGQQRPSQQPSGNAFDASRGQRPGNDGYNYNRPAQGQEQRGPAQRPSQAFGDTGDNQISGPASRPNQFNQPQRNQPGSQPQGSNQGRPSNQYSPQPTGQAQGDNGYNYNIPQTGSQSPSQGSQGGQPQKPFSGFGNNQEPSGQPQGQRPSNVNQPRPQFSQNQFGSQSQNSPSQSGQTQGNNGYTYNQPQYNRPQAPVQGPQGSQGSRFQGNQPNNNNVFGQQPSQPTRDFNQAQRPTSDSNNAFGRPQGPSNQYSQAPRGQDQSGSGYNYNQPQKSSGSQPGQSQTYSQGIPSPSGPQAGPNSQFGQPQRPTQGPFSGNQQGSSNKFPSGQRGQDQDENGYYYNRPQSTQPQGSFGQRPQTGAPNQPGISSRPTSSFDSNNQGARPSSMKASFGQNRNGSNTDREEYSPENRPSFGYSQPGPQGYDSSRPTEKFQPSLNSASPIRPQQSGQNRPTSFGPSGQDAPNQSQNRPSSFGLSAGNAPSQSQNKPSSFGPSAGNAPSQNQNRPSSFGPSSAPSQGQNRPSSFGPSAQNAPEQTLAQGYQYGPGQSNQPQRPGSSGQGSGTPGATRVPGSEFGGPRQPPSFSEEEGYKY